MRIRHVDPERGLALCEAADGQRRTVELALVAPATVGDVVLVHADVAIARLESEPREEPEEVIG
jgi:hydrogenase maturation factor